jgi:sugar lactone lactonase YvrE
MIGSCTIVLSSLFIPAAARWAQNGVTVAGGHGKGGETNQLYGPRGLLVDDEDTVIVADWRNHRIVEWKRGDTSGTVLAGDNGQGNGPDQLNEPTDVIYDKETDSLIICDSGNRRVTRWPRRNGTRRGETISDNIDCLRLAMDDEGSLYVTDWQKHEVRRYRRGETNYTVVAGGNGKGGGLHQLNLPLYVCVDAEHAVYVSDNENHRVMKWVKNAKEGIVVAGGRGQGKDLTQLSRPHGVLVDATGNVYVADYVNARVMRWCRGATQGTVVVGGNGEGERANQFYGLTGLSFDRHGHLYVADFANHRVQRFPLEKN